MSAINEALRLDLVRWTDGTLDGVIQELAERGGDGEAVEVKSAANGCPDVASTLSAFANMPDGGLLILGLTDPAFEPVGLDDIARLEGAVAAIAREGVVPPISCSFATLKYKRCPVLVCRIRPLPLADRPARAGGYAYLRQSDGDYLMSDQEVAFLDVLRSQAQHRTHPDREAVEGATLDVLDTDLLEDYIATSKTSSRRLSTVDDDTILRWTNVLTDTGAVTVAGCYALARYPQQYLPHLAVTAAIQLPANVPGRHRNLVHLDGPLPEQLEAAVQWVQRNVSHTMHYNERGHGYDEYDLPLAAVREVIANALVHRSLAPITDCKSIDIRLRDDKLTVTSPGGLWGVSVHQLGTPAGRSAVNPALYDMCKRVRLADGSRVVEGEGGGIREARQALAAAGLRGPRFVDSGVRFTAVLWAHSLLTDSELAWLREQPETQRLGSLERAVLMALYRGDSLSNAQIRDTFAPLDSTEVRRMMQRMADAGLIDISGSRGQTRYSIAAEFGAKSTADDSSASPRERAVVDALDQPRSLSELVDATGLTKSQLHYALAALREQGRVALVGDSRRTAQYELTDT